MKLLTSFVSLVAGALFISGAVAQPTLNACEGNMSGLTNCLLMSSCYSCLSSQTSGVSSNSDPASDVCNSFVCPVIGELDCCPQCTSEATAMKDCVVEVITSNGGPESACLCGTETPDDNPGTCDSAIEEYDSCMLNEGADCVFCSPSPFVGDITSGTVDIADCENINKQLCEASQCCCGPELEQVVQCALEDSGSTCEISKDCDSEPPEEGPSPESPDEEDDTCSDLVVAYELCLSEENCRTCVDEAVALSPRSFNAGSTSSCQAVHEAICPAAACCCSAELEALSECSHLEDHDVECDINCSGYNARDSGDDSSDVGEPNEPPVDQSDKCADAAALYDMCVETSECSSECQLVDSIARTSLAALGEGQSDYSCDTINGMICPAVSCCCGEELTELTECTLEATSEACNIECDDNAGSSDDGNDQPTTPASSTSSIRSRALEATMPGIALIAGLSWLFAW